MMPPSPVGREAFEKPAKKQKNSPLTPPLPPHTLGIEVPDTGTLGLRNLATSGLHHRTDAASANGRWAALCPRRKPKTAAPFLLTVSNLRPPTGASCAKFSKSFLAAGRGGRPWPFACVAGACPPPPRLSPAPFRIPPRNRPGQVTHTPANPCLIYLYIK